MVSEFELETAHGDSQAYRFRDLDVQVEKLDRILTVLWLIM